MKIGSKELACIRSSLLIFLQAVSPFFMKKKKLPLSLFFLILFCLFVGAPSSWAFIRIFSAPVFSTDRTDKYLYFQGPNNLLFKVASDSPEIVIASENSLNPFPEPVTWNAFKDLTTTAATQLGTSATIYSSPSVPGDGWCYFQGATNSNYLRFSSNTFYSLSRISVDGDGFSTFGGSVTTAFAPAASTDGYVYYFSYTDAIAPNLQGVPKLFKIPTGAASGNQAQAILANSSASVFGLSAPCVPGNGMIYFQGKPNPGPSSELVGISTSGGPIIHFNYLTLSAPFVGLDHYGIPNGGIYFQGGDQANYSQLCSMETADASNFVPQTQAILATPYVGQDRCVYFLGIDNTIYQYDLRSSLFNPRSLYIHANSPPVSYDNGDGTITLFFQGTDNQLQKFTPPKINSL